MSKQNLTVYRGISYPMSYTHIEPMTGGTVYFTVKSTEFDTDATDTTAMPKATVTSFTVNDTRADWVFTDEDMYIPPGKYYYDLIFEDADGLSLPPIFEGQFKVLPHPTNRNVGNE